MEIRSLFPADWAFATVGSRRTAIELVMAEGNRIKGMAIPVSTPYMEKASSLFNPKAWRRLGIQMASALPRRFNTSRFPIKGRARDMRGITSERKEGGSYPLEETEETAVFDFWGGNMHREQRVNRAEAASPIGGPAQPVQP